MTTVLEIKGIKEEDGVTKYKCVIGENKYRWLERHRIANFNNIPNPYAEKEDVSNEELKVIARTTKAVYDLILKKRGTVGIKKHVKRMNKDMFIYENEDHNLEVLYTEDDKQERAVELADYYLEKLGWNKE